MKRLATLLAVSALLIAAPLGFAPRAAARPPLNPPWIQASYSPATVRLGSTSTLRFGIENQNGEAIGGVGFIDYLPDGLRVGNSTTSVCGGTLTTVKPTTVTLSGATIAASAWCKFDVTVATFAAGTMTSTSSAVTSTDTIDGNKATASLTVYAPPKITAGFSPATAEPGAVTALEITITNPASNTIELSNIGVSGNLPDALWPFGSSGITVCGGTFTLDGSHDFALAGATLAVGAACTFTVQVQGYGEGDHAAPVVATLSGSGYTGGTVTATLHVTAPRPTPTHHPATPTPGPAGPAATEPVALASPTADATPPEASSGAELSPDFSTDPSAVPAPSASPTTPPLIWAPPGTPAGPTGGFSDAAPWIALGLVGICGLGCLLFFLVSKRRRAAA
jgi:hypothetical protein